MNTEIKILHSSCCAKGSPIKQQIEQLATKNNLNISIEELSELKDTMIYGTMIFPSLVIKGKVYDYKRYNSDEKLLTLIQQ